MLRRAAKIRPSAKSEHVAIAKFEQEAHPKAGLGETPPSLIGKHCRYSILEKFEDAFDTALDLMQTKPSDAAFLADIRTSLNADQKHVVTSYPVRL